MERQMSLKELLEETDALTYLNALQVTLKELKTQFASIEEMQEYTQSACDRSKKLIRRADHQYRLLAKIVHGQNSLAPNEVIDDNIDVELQELMEDE